MQHVPQTISEEGVCAMLMVAYLSLGFAQSTLVGRTMPRAQCISRLANQLCHSAGFHMLQQAPTWDLAMVPDRSIK